MNEQDPYGQPQPEQQPPAFGQQAPQGFPVQGFGAPALPKHPQAQTALILGLIALAGGATCILPILVSPFAWYFGAKAKREMQAEPNRWSGESDAQAGFVMGIIGTIGIIIGLIGLFAIIALLVALGESSTY